MSRLRAMTIDLTEHVRKEDEVLFPQTIRVEDSARLHELRM
jgi:iron-sulfur cluster repair protein YtfE (RIC family)